MTLGFMQPYFVPYLGYFDLIRQTDEWVVFDTAQYIRRGWVNRNRVLKAGGGISYITVPVRYAPLETPIADIQVDDGQPWRARILAQFDVIRSRAPYFEPVRALLEATFQEPNTSLGRINLVLLGKCCAYLGIPFRPRLFSSLNISADLIEGPGDWALQVCRTLGANEYLNPVGGRTLYDPQRFALSGVKLRIQQFVPMRYDTPGYSREDNLSILDVLAWNNPAAVIAHLDGQPRD